MREGYKLELAGGSGSKQVSQRQTGLAVGYQSRNDHCRIMHVESQNILTHCLGAFTQKNSLPLKQFFFKDSGAQWWSTM